MCLLCGLMFYEFYFKWMLLFEDGRYFDPDTGVVYHDTAFIGGIFSLVLLLISIALWLVARKIRRRRIS
jgi:ABC-type antimicrobial peptide transport system permease subunit